MARMLGRTRDFRTWDDYPIYIRKRKYPYARTTRQLRKYEKRSYVKEVLEWLEK